jgi:hypothetical protein
VLPAAVSFPGTSDATLQSDAATIAVSMANDGYVRTAAFASSDNAAYGRRTFQGLPSLARTGQRLWAVWLGDRNSPGGENTGTYLILSYSDNAGATWSREIYLVPEDATTDRVLDPRLWTAPDGSVWVLYGQAGNRKTHDGQQGAWANVITNPLDSVPTVQPGFWLADGVPMRPFQVDGRWGIPIDYWFSPAPRFPGRAGKNIYRLDWAGRRVQYLTRVPRSFHADFDETTVVQLADGSLLAQSRTLAGIVQSRGKGPDYAWTEPAAFARSPSIGSRHVIRRSPTGRLVMVFNKSMAGNLRADMTVMLSDDDGATWPYSYPFDATPQISYPDLEFAANGDLLVIYDHERFNRKRILLATIRESTIVTGSPSVTIQVVNQQ